MKKQSILTCILVGMLLWSSFSPVVTHGEGVHDADVLVPQPSGKSILAQLYAQKAPTVVYMTGISIEPEKKLTSEFFRPSQETKEEHTVGTGFVIHEDGYIVTNAHVVNRSLMPEVEFMDGRRLPGEIVAIVPEEDLVLVKVSATEKLAFAKFEQKPQVVPGDTVVAIGCPRGLKYTLTYGIVSGINRTSAISDIPGLVLHGLLQTDAATNPGSSGGPWFNLNGNVIGVTVSKLGNADNIAYGISLETIHYQLPRMLHRAVKKQWNLPFRVVGTRQNVQHRARLTELDPEFAECWNLVEGDCVLAVNGQEVQTPIDFYLTLLSAKTGNHLELTIRRDNHQVRVERIAERITEHVGTTPEIQATMGSQPAGTALGSGEECVRCELELTTREMKNVEEYIQNRLALRVRALTDEERTQFNLRVPTALMIESVDTAQYAYLKHPPRTGDILAKINFQRPSSPGHLAEILENISEKGMFNLVVLRHEQIDGKANLTRIDINNWKKR